MAITTRNIRLANCSSAQIHDNNKIRSKKHGQLSIGTHPAIHADVIVGTLLLGKEAGLDIVPVGPPIPLKLNAPPAAFAGSMAGQTIQSSVHRKQKKSHLNLIGSSLSGPFSFVLHSQKRQCLQKKCPDASNTLSKKPHPIIVRTSASTALLAICSLSIYPSL